MKFIGIDPGTKCGWAVLDSEGVRLASGVWDLTARRHEGGGMRFVRLNSYLHQILGAHDLADVLLGYEEVRRHMGTDAAHVYGGIVATITRICEELAVPYRGIPVGTVKKLATGKGNASKEAMVEAAELRWSQGRRSVAAPMADDEADALWIAEALRQELG